MPDWIPHASLAPGVQAALDAAAGAAALDDSAAAALAAAFYKDFKTGQLAGTLGPGWNKILQGSQAGGYDGMAWHHPASRTLVVVNRGTEGFASFPDWVQNVGAQILSQPGPQLHGAVDLLRDAFLHAPQDQIAQILICGHSLGGALADVQGAVGRSLLVQAGIANPPPIRTVGIASAGFKSAGQALAGQRGLTIDLKADIVHYIRAEDAVPHLPGHGVFGTEKPVASVYEARLGYSAGAHPTPQWQRIADFLREHTASLYWKFLAEGEGRHVWYSRSQDGYLARAGTPQKRWGSRPKDW
ncbi:hypothetical protein QO010_003270 [Caulobacter ginsengisoli]|uniref:Fungal lipase-type domain-containing protein n=1 Tax=Caulobacter ginsengisoli TaxID=400775 RepID=A0ABU0IVV9_9CAUL|nr:hypothetical protein [Caulobacter ginsengisoli]MDQ0465481.1 hypothetical protein [Caulobacter ginsengisoli]